MKIRYWILGSIVVLIGAAIFQRWSIVDDLKPMNTHARQQAPGQFAALSDGDVHYSWHGPENGEVTILVHGFSTPSFVWNGLLEQMTKAGLRVLTYDHFGRGWSDRPEATYNADFFDRQLTELLISQKISSPVNLVGYSMGGAVSTYFAAHHPQQVKKLALIAPAGFPVNEGTLAQIIKMPVIGDWLMDMVGRQSLLDEMKKPKNQGKAVPDIVDRYELQMSYAGYLPALLSTLRHFPMGKMDAEFQKIGRSQLPVLALWGTNDTVVPPSNAEMLKQAVPSASVQLLEGGSHAITYSHPEEVSSALVIFFEK